MMADRSGFVDEESVSVSDGDFLDMMLCDDSVDLIIRKWLL